MPATAFAFPTSRPIRSFRRFLLCSAGPVTYSNLRLHLTTPQAVSIQRSLPSWRGDAPQMGPTARDGNHQASPRSLTRGFKFTHDARQTTSWVRPGADFNPLDFRALQACSSSPAAQVTLNPLPQPPLGLLGRSVVK